MTKMVLQAAVALYSMQSFSSSGKEAEVLKEFRQGASVETRHLY